MKRRIISVILVMILVLTLVACENKSSLSNGYQTFGEWAMYDRNYMFAVEVDDFDGDVYKAGTYRFRLEAGRTQGLDGVLPAIFDVYIDDQEYNTIAELKQAIPEPQLSIGGIGSESIEIEYELLVGQYVYIIPYQEIVYEPSGYLRFELIA